MQSKGRGSHAPYQATPPMLRSVVGLNCHSSRGGTETLNIRHWAGKQKASLRGGGERTVQDHGTSTSEGYISPLIPMPSAPGHELARLVHGLRTRPVNSGMEPTSICGTVAFGHQKPVGRLTALRLQEDQAGRKTSHRHMHSCES
jgi:hypothetical protein